MKSYKILKSTILLLFILNVHTVSSKGWIPLINGLGNQLNSVFFTDSQTGYIAGNGTILKTSDGGDSWTKTINSDNNFFSVYFTDATTGYVTGGFFEGFILKTTDGGSSWSTLIYTDDWFYSLI